MPLDSFLADTVLQAIARENNLAETAFLVPEDREYRVRWFTPAAEVPLCGHATLASAAVIMERLEPHRDRVIFHSASGPLTVTRSDQGYVMDFPARRMTAVPTPPELVEALGTGPLEVAVDAHNYLAVLDSEEVVRELAPDIAAVARLDRSGLIVTARSNSVYDFVSRYFAPPRASRKIPLPAALTARSRGIGPHDCERPRFAHFKRRNAAGRSCAASSATASNSKAVACSTSKARWTSRTRH